MSARDERGVFGTLFRHELRMLVRDTRMLVITFGVPLIAFPLLVLVFRGVEERESRRLEETVFRYSVVGPRADEARDILSEALAGTEARFEELAAEHADSLLTTGALHVVVEATTAETDATGASNLPLLRLRFRAANDFSRAASAELERRLAEHRLQARDDILRSAGFPVRAEDVLPVEPRNLADPEREGSALLGLALTPFVLLLMLTGGSIVAVDTLTGEKERGTLETLLTTGAERSDVVRAKQAAIVFFGLVLVVVNLLNILGWLVLGFIDLPAGMILALGPPDLLVLLTLMAPLTLLVANALLLLSGVVDSYKEYQIAFFPLLLGFIGLAVLGMLPGMELRSPVALVPVAGIGVAVREVAAGRHDWLFLALPALSTGAFGWALSRFTGRALSTERLVGGAMVQEAEYLGGPAVFPLRVLRWVALLWALFFIFSQWVGAWVGIRGQVTFNLVVLFGGGALAMIRAYDLPWKRALFLRPPRPTVWLATLIGAPAGYVTGLGLASLVSAYLFPVPQSVLEAFGEVLLDETVPLWQMVLFFALMPALFEEVAFRGVILYGLRSRLKPLALCLAVGAIFGIFHVSLFRIIPTAYLGALLAATVLLTGSLLPAILWHFLNNSLALVPAQLGWVGLDTELPGWAYLVSLAALGLAFGLMWRARVDPSTLPSPEDELPRLRAAARPAVPGLDGLEGGRARPSYGRIT